MLKVSNLFVLAALAFLCIETKLLTDRKLNILQTSAHPRVKNLNRKLAGINDLLGADDVEELAEKSRVSDFEARQMAVNASQKQQRLSQLLNLVNNFKSSMEEVTTSLNGQISQINGLLSQVKD